MRGAMACFRRGPRLGASKGSRSSKEMYFTGSSSPEGAVGEGGSGSRVGPKVPL